MLFIALCLAAAAVYFAYLLTQLNIKHRQLVDKYAPIKKVEDEVQRITGELSRLGQEKKKLSQEYEKGKAILQKLKFEIYSLEENLEDISYGFYKPHFTFQTSEKCKILIEQVREHERQLIRDNSAVKCGAQWTVGGSESEGARMTKQYSKLLLRAFNGECDAAIANVSWNNVGKMEERLRHAHEAINKTGAVMQIAISQDYLDLKIEELKLMFEYEEKKYQEREEQKRIREQMREEEKARIEIEEAREEAEREEERYRIALEKAREEAAIATGEQVGKLADIIKTLESQLAEARKEKERAVSMAQLTKRGNVYVISNIGAFGENVYKIGMTRRMEPEDRVEELSGASVPFPYDIHAMFKSDNAPELEAQFHEHFQDRKLNLVNDRREFFRASIEEIEQFAIEKGCKTEVTKVAEAREYRESEAIRINKTTGVGIVSTSKVSDPAQEYPPDLFGEQPPPIPA